MFNNVETLVDELGSAYSYSVLVLNPFFVVNGNQHVEEVFGALYVLVGIGEVNDVCHLVFEFGDKLLLASSHDVKYRAVSNVDYGRLVDKFIKMVGLCDNHLSDWSFYGRAYVAAICIVVFDGLVVFCIPEFGEYKSAVGINCHLKTASEQIRHVNYFGFYRVGCAIEHFVAECAFLLVRIVDAKAFYYFGDNRRRLDGNQLVVDARLGIEKTEVREVVHAIVYCRCALGIGLNHYHCLPRVRLLRHEDVERSYRHAENS